MREKCKNGMELPGASQMRDRYALSCMRIGYEPIQSTVGQHISAN